MNPNNYTLLLGPALCQVGFALFENKSEGVIIYQANIIKSYRANAYSLKAIKRYCKLYLQRVRAS